MSRDVLVKSVTPLMAPVGPHLAEDVLQAALHQVWNVWLTQGAPDNPRAYVRTVAVRTALKVRSNEIRLPCVPLEEAFLGAAPDTTVLAGLRIDLERALV